MQEFKGQFKALQAMVETKCEQQVVFDLSRTIRLSATIEMLYDYKDAVDKKLNYYELRDS
jgi:hypothetical protein